MKLSKISQTQKDKYHMFSLWREKGEKGGLMKIKERLLGWRRGSGERRGMGNRRDRGMKLIKLYYMHV